MQLGVDELIKKAKDQWARKRYEEALISALAAVAQDDKNGEAWWQVALSRESLGDSKNAIIALRKTVELIPHGCNVWARLGDLLMKGGNLNEAKEAFEAAILLYEDQTTALIGLSHIYNKEDLKEQDDKEISALEKIEQLLSLSKTQINRLGILYYRNGRYHDAIHCWKKNVWNADHPSQRFNLGLAYSHSSISQHADAIDMWRLVLRNWPEYELAQKSIANLLPTLLTHAEKARREGDSILPQDQWFNYYINPFQLINIPDDADIDEIDTKTIQRLKKNLLQEIELEDGRVSWMPGIGIDKSRAIGLCDELHDEVKMDWHWQVYSNKPLLRFLTKGSHEHFLVRADGSELDTINCIEWDDDFLEWLGKFFAPQYDRVLTKAIEQGNVTLVECLLHGRRWVPISMVDDCFHNAQKAVEELVKQLEEISNTSNEFKPSFNKIEMLLNQSRFIEIMNSLPVFFEQHQSKTIHLIRGIAINAFNVHDDIDLSKKITELARKFKHRSIDLNIILDEDIKTIEEIIRKEREHEAKLTSSGQKWEITKEGIRQGDKFIAAGDVSAVKWGIIVTNEVAGKYWDFLLSFTADDGRKLAFQWKTTESEKSRIHFDNLITASLNYVFPFLLEKIETKLSSNKSINIGPCRVTKYGIHYETQGWIFSSQHFTPWSKAKIEIDNGNLFVIDKSDPKKRTSFSLRDTDNANLLSVLLNIRNQRE